MRDEAGRDSKVLCVPERDPNYQDVHDCSDLPGHLLEEIQHFFDMYKVLEPGKSATTVGYEGRDAAWQEIEAAQERYRRSSTTTA
jgi:inorganic pyrophosphatase